MTPRHAWARCAAAGVAAVICSWAFGRIGIVACGPTGGAGPIIALEMVRSPGELAALFGSEPCRSALVAAQKTGLVLDGLGFIPFYTAFLIFGTAAAAGARGGARAALIAMFLVAGLSDEIEGYVLRRILNDLPGTPAQIDALFWIVQVKFALLAFGTTGIAALLCAARRRATILPGLWIAVWGLYALQALAVPSPARMMTAIAIAWGSLLAIALTASFRPSLFSPARAGPPPARATPSA